TASGLPLFFVGEWPTELYIRYAEEDDSEALAQLACDAIDAFVEAPEQFDWSDYLCEEDDA
ncbi:MAG: hypothetical protein AAFY15_13340, partial [Cyanobacteria bacterium J06648_11]